MVDFGSNSPLPLFEPSPITMCPSLAYTPSTGLHASPSIKIHPVLLTQSTPLLIYVSHSSSKALHSPCSFRVVSCARRSWCMGGATHLRFAWCSTPPTANAYTTRSCYARLPARFGHILLSCGVQFEGESGRGSRTVLLFNYPRDNNCTALRPYLLKKELGRKCEVVFSFCIKCVIIFHILSKAWLNTVI